jgi:hypothetical protein
MKPQPTKRASSLSELSTKELLILHAEVSAELCARGVCRSGNNPVADYAEGLAAKALGLQLAKESTTGFDATDSSGLRYEIKARRITTTSKATMLSAIRGLENKHFDLLIAVVFNEDYTVNRAVMIPHKTVEKIARFRKHVNAHILMLRDIWKAEDARDITAKLAGVV